MGLPLIIKLFPGVQKVLNSGEAYWVLGGNDEGVTFSYLGGFGTR